MLGAIAGDVIGSVYEGKKAWQKVRTPHFEPLFAADARFTDDTVLTVAVAESILHGGDLVDLLKGYARTYPGAGYGGTFRQWAESDDRELTEKYADHIPLYRQERRLARQGVEITRSTLCDWMGGAAEVLEPLYEFMKTLILLCGTIHTDDTSVKVRDSERKINATGRLWISCWSPPRPSAAPSSPE